MAFPSTAHPSAARSEANAPLASGKTAPLLRGPFASKGSGENPKGDLLRPGMRRSSPCGRAGLSIDGARARRQVGSACAPCKQKKRPRFCGAVLRQREAERIRRATSLSPGYAQKQPLRQCRSCHRRRARPSPGRKRLCPLQAEKTAPFLRGRFASKGSGEDLEGDLLRPGMRRSSPCGRAGLAIDGAPVRRQVGSACAPCKRQNGPAFAGPYRAKGRRRGSGGRPLSPPGMRRSSPGGRAGHAIDGAPVRRQVGSARALCKQKKRPRFCGALLRQREAERIWRAISFARVLDTSCSGVSPR